MGDLLLILLAGLAGPETIHGKSTGVPTGPGTHARLHECKYTLKVLL